MATPPESTDRRRSQRVLLSTPLTVSCLDPFLVLSGRYTTCDVSDQGCGFIASRPFQRDAWLRLTIQPRKSIVTAHVISSMPDTPDSRADTWFIGVELDASGNYWTVQSASPDRGNGA